MQNERRKKIKSGEIHPQKRKDKPEVPDGFKFCYHCEKILPLDDFGSDKKSKDGKTLYCKSCAKQMYFEKPILQDNSVFQVSAIAKDETLSEVSIEEKENEL